MAAPSWKGLVDWSIRNHSGNPSEAAARVSDTDRAWLEEALAHSTVDYGQQMRAMKALLDSGEEETQEQVEQKEAALEALTDIVENIDFARDLTSIGGMSTLLRLLNDKHSSIRWRAAEVIATCAQLNEPVQKEYLEANCIPKLLHLLQDQDSTCRQKALLALSCLVRNNEQGLHLFLANQGITRLIQILTRDEARNQRKAVQLLSYVATESRGKIPADQISSAAPDLLQSESLDVRESTLKLFLKLCQHSESYTTLAQDKSLRDIIDDRIQTLGALKTEEDVTDAQDEKQSLAQLKQRLLGTDTPVSSEQSTRYSQGVRDTNTASSIPLLSM